jgi:cobalt/nickel transport system permease protein
MSGGHAHVLYWHGGSPVHRLAAQAKLPGALLAVLAVVATPREQLWAFGAHLAVLLAVWAVAGIGVGWFARRAVIELPFVVLAVLLPFAAGEPRVAPFGVTLSVAGLYAGWSILAKGTLGVLVSLTLAGTTPVRDLLVGLQRLRAPTMVVTIATLMLRYLEVIVEEARRMRVARISRGHDPRLITQAGATARGIGTLFLRSYERGERVHLAMLSRGWTSAMPHAGRRASRAELTLALLPGLAMALVATAAWWLR